MTEQHAITTGRRATRLICLGGLVGFAMAVAVGAQDGPSQSLGEELGRIIGVGVVLSSGDFVGGGSFDIDDDGGSIKVQHLPWHHRFGDGEGRYKPWILGALGRTVIRQPIELLGEPPDRSKFEADGLAAVGGVEILLGSGGWYVEPSGGLIYSWIESELRYNSPESEALAPILDGVFFNWEAEALTLTAAARLGYRTAWDNGTAVDLAAHVVGLWTNPVSTDSPVQDNSSSSNYARFQARVRIPLGGEIPGGNRLFLVPRVDHTIFSEEIEEPLESSSMTVLNARLLVEFPEAPDDASRWRRYMPRAAGLNVGYTTADTFAGWTFGITFHPWSSGW